MATAQVPTADRLKEIMSYEPDTGEFRHLRVKRGVRHGALAGGINPTDGFRYIGIDGRKYSAQRLAWLYIKGEWPEYEVGFLDQTLESPLRERFDNLAMTVVGELTAAEVRQIFNYDPETGWLTYRTPRRGVTVGRRAGSIDTNGYRYIGVRGQYFTAQRLAWVHATGEWPDSDVRFRNGDKDDTSIRNLFQPIGVQTIPVLRREHQKKDRKEKPAKYRDSDLRRDFGIDLGEYQRMHDQQGGTCAICKQPETVMRNGRIKWMAVDHNHATGAIRGILCSSCNQGIGKMRDDPALLRAAADYIEKHEKDGAV
jgi:hypothetical protein